MARMDWTRVELEKVVDPILSGNLKHRYVQRYIFSIINSAQTEASIDRPIEKRTPD